jgi:hypothetical protein
MGEPDAQLEVRASQAGPVADALDLEAFLEAFRHTLDHVRDQRPGEPVERTILAALRRPGDQNRLAVLLDRHPGWDLLGELPQRSVDLDAAGPDRDHDAGGKLDWLSTDTAHGSRHHTKQITSPPTPCCSADLLVITPLDVDMIAVPIPPSTRGMRSLRA